jgi:hypothetical protein
MKLLVDHKSERPIEIRAGEAWPEVLAQFNHIRGELLTLRREVSEYEAMLGNAAISQLNETQNNRSEGTESKVDVPNVQASNLETPPEMVGVEPSAN